MDQAHATILRDIAAWDARRDPLRWDDARFDAHVRAIFAHQFAYNKPYRAFCEGRGVEPSRVSTWRDVPAVPTDVFKHVRLTCASAAPERTFRTSGTTQGARGEHHMGSVEVYRASLRGPFERFLLPDRPAMRILSLVPSPTGLPDSSLSFMIGELADDATLWPVSLDATRGWSFDLGAIFAALDASQASGEPLLLVGTAFAFAEVMERAGARRWALPDGSRLMETGGFKGRTREVSRDAFYAALTATFGVPERACVAEYSMTELSSQAYTDSLWRHHHDQPWEPGRLMTAPWARMVIVDPVTLEPIDAPGRAGLMRWIDLANTESVIAVQTSDLGVAHADGAVTLIGRAPDAELRGCSLTIEEILDHAARP